jgi:hypothetical protein
MARLVYPEQIDKSLDYIKFEFGEYKSPFKSPPSGTNPLAYGSNLSFTGNGKQIYLPMPSDIGSAFQGNWGGKEVTGLAQAALGTAGVTVGNTITGSINQKITGFGNLLSPDGLKNTGGALAADALNALGSAFANLPGLGANLTATDVLQLTTESIVNPNTELLYSGTGLRTHGYSFKMIPQSESEANDVMEIIESFKTACAPKQNAAAFGGTFKNFIGLPDLCQVSFISETTDNKYLPRYKVSGITSVNVNYVTDGQFVSYRKGHPLGVVLTVSLTETKLIFSEEIGSGASQYR